MADTSNSDSNVKIDITATTDNLSAGVNKAQVELDRLGNSTSALDQKYKVAVDSSEKVANVTNRVSQEFATLGKEVITGETSRIPGTVASIAAGLFPVAAAVAGVTAAVGAGVWAWMQWGSTAEDSVKKATDALKKAEDEANKAKHMSTQEQIRAKELRLESLRGEIAAVDIQIAKLQELNIQHKLNADQQRQLEIAYQTRGALSRNIANETQNIQTLEAPGNRKDSTNQDRISREISAERKKYEDLAALAEMADSNAIERINVKTARTLQKMDEEHVKAIKIRGENTKLDATYQQARLDVERAAQEEIDRIKENVLLAERKKLDKMQEMEVLAAADHRDRILYQGGFELAQEEQSYQDQLKAYGDIEGAEELHNNKMDAIRAASAAKLKAYDDARMQNEMSVVNFAKNLRDGEFTHAMTIAQNMTAGLARHSRAAFEVNKAASIAVAVMNTYKGISGVLAEFPGPVGWVMAAAQAALGIAQVTAINSTQFGGGGSAAIPNVGGGVPSQATSPGVPVTQTPTPSQSNVTPVNISIYNNGTFVDAQAFIDGTVIPQLKDSITNSDVVIIDPRSRQAQMLGA